MSSGSDGKGHIAEDGGSMACADLVAVCKQHCDCHPFVMECYRAFGYSLF